MKPVFTFYLSLICAASGSVFAQSCAPSVLNPTTPAQATLTGWDVTVSGDYAYVVSNTFGLRIVDISTPANPITENPTNPPVATQTARGVFLSGTYAYVVSQDFGLRIVDVSNPSNPLTQNPTNPPVATLTATGVFVSGDYAYVVSDSFGLRIVDISNPSNPVTRNPTNPPVATTTATGVFVSGDYAYVVSDSFGLRVVDISNPSNPVTRNPTNPPVATTTATDVFVSGDYAYVVSDTFGLRIVDVSSPTNPVTLNPTTPAAATLTGAGVYVCNDYAYVVSGGCSAGQSVGVDCNFGLRIVDVSDPTNPMTLNPTFTPGDNMHTTLTSRGVFVAGDTAYVVSATYGLRMVDLDTCGCISTTFFDLMVIVLGSGSVTSTEQPPGIVNCSATTGTCVSEYPEGTVVTLTPTPAPGYVFSGWVGDCTDGIVTMDADKFCGVKFDASAQGEIVKSGPSAVPQDVPFTYTLDYFNTGISDLTNVVIQDTLPDYLTFVSASNGGTHSNRTVTWNIGTLPTGASGQVTLTVATSCFTSYEMINSNYKLTSTETGSVDGTIPVTTTFEVGAAEPVTVSVASIPQNTPLKSGDIVTHTITLSNSSTFRLPCLRMTIGAGSSMSFDAILDNGGGEIQVQNANYRQWRGSIDPNSSTSIVLTTRVDDCVTRSEVALNSGSALSVFAGSTFLGSGSAALIPVQRPIAATLSALNLGPAQDYHLLGDNHKIQVARSASYVDFQITLTNHLPTDQTNVSIQIPLAEGITDLADPPFIPPTEPAAAYDSFTRTISWTGTIPANQTVIITFRGKLDTSQSCRVDLPLAGSAGQCDNIRASLSILVVPQPPRGSYILGTSPYSGLYTFQPNLDAGFQQFLCLPVEILWGSTLAPNGDLWVAGLPVFRFNAETLDLEIFGQDFLRNMGVEGIPRDAAYDATTDTVVFLETSHGMTARSAVLRYDPVSRQASEILDDLPAMVRIVVDPNGIIAGLSRDGLIRIDPADAVNYQTFTDPAYIDPTYGTNNSLLSLDANSDYIIQGMEYFGFAVVREPLVRIDHRTGVFTEIVPDLRTLLPCIPSHEYYSCSALPGTANLYLGISSGADVAQIQLSPSSTGQCLAALGTRPASPAFYGLSDMEYIADIVNHHHFTQLARQWRATGPNLAADLDGDNDVDFDDLRELTLKWLANPPRNWPLE